MITLKIPDKMIWRKIIEDTKCVVCGFYEDVDYKTRICEPCENYIKNVKEKL